MEKQRKSRAKPGASKGGSRPAGPEPVRTVVPATVTEGEAEAIRAAAKAVGLSVSAWLRGAAQNELARVALARSVDAAIEEAAELRRELGR